MNDFAPAVLQILREAGFSLLRRGKGDHSIWAHPDGRRTLVDGKIKSRHTANGVLKQAKLPKAF
jgi:predicted RNA binding protein YcfA (HicA-like mRNA interferase family)